MFKLYFYTEIFMDCTIPVVINRQDRRYARRQLPIGLHTGGTQ